MDESAKIAIKDFEDKYKAKIPPKLFEGEREAIIDFEGEGVMIFCEDLEGEGVMVILTLMAMCVTVIWKEISEKNVEILQWQ